MTDFIKENKLFAGLIIGIILIVGAYFAYNSGQTDDLLVSTETNSETAAISRELLTTLASLKALTLDTSVFQDQVYVSLVDFGIEIPLQPVGRDNPFAPLSRTGTRTTTGGVTHVVPVGTPR